MKVTLIQHTTDINEVIATAAHQCVSADDAAEFFDELLDNDTDRASRIIQKTIGRGHTSVLEHASFTFVISGVSRSLTHQLVRFRIASFSQQSQRYVTEKVPFEYITPDTIQNASSYVSMMYWQLMDHISNIYTELIKEGVPAEDARFVLPNACETAIIMTMNARELLHLFSLRCCEHAQWEIREMAWRMLELVKPISRVIFDKAGPACFRGPCPEGDRCCGGSKRVRTACA